jgi:uncharacterized membrane protein YdjX (TVP38/TMEM64 family)
MGKMSRKQYRILSVAAVGLALAGFTVLWHWSPLAGYADVGRLVRVLREVETHPALPFLFIGAYIGAGLTMFPMTVLNTAVVLICGPWHGLEYAYIGNFASALVTFWVVRFFGRGPLHSVSGGRILQLSEGLARRGVLSVILMRNIPVSFALISAAAAVSHIRFRDYLLGTAMGMLPGILVVCFLAGGIKEMIYRPRWEYIGLLFGAGLVLLYLWKRFIDGLRRELRREGEPILPDEEP